MKKNRLFNFVLALFITISFVNFNCIDIAAATFSVKASPTTVSPGGTFKVTVSANGAGKFSFSASNGSVSVSSAFVDGSYSFDVTAGQSGMTTVSVSADDATGTDETPITGSKSVSVSIKAPSSGNGSGTSGSNTNTPTTDNRSKINVLSSLSVSTGTLSPKFSASTTSYKVDLTSDVTKLTINAKAKDSKAKVSGDGEKELKVGENNFVITVLAENGAKKTYTISVYVTEKPSVFTKFSGNEYGILSDFSKSDLPKGYEPTTVKVDNKDVAALKSETTGLVLLYLQDSEGKTSFYIYENDAVVGKYQTVSVNQKTYVVLNDEKAIEKLSGVKSGTIKIGDLEVQGWTFNDKTLANYSLVYLMNDAGDKGLYSYEGTEGTLQKYVPSQTSDNTLTYVFIGTTALFVITTAVAVGMYFNFKKKSISTIRDYYDSKNQGE